MVAFFCAALAMASGCTEVDREAQLQDFNKTCQLTYGFKTGTPEFSQCMMTLDQGAQADADRRRMAAAAAMQSASTGFYNSAAAMRPITCTQTPGYGGTVTTRC
jgi:hypothetical protein